MKVEVELLNETHEKLLANSTGMGRLIDLTIQVLEGSHSHSDMVDGRKAAVLKELEEMHQALNDLHITWKTAYWLQIRAANTPPASKSLYNYHFWNIEEKVHGPLFTLCSDHVTTCHIPPGQTLNRSGRLPLVGACKFCELEAISRERIR